MILSSRCPLELQAKQFLPLPHPPLLAFVHIQHQVIGLTAGVRQADSAIPDMNSAPPQRAGHGKRQPAHRLSNNRAWAAPSAEGNGVAWFCWILSLGTHTSFFKIAAKKTPCRSSLHSALFRLQFWVCSRYPRLDFTSRKMV